MAAERLRHVGHPRKYEDGWAFSHKRISLSIDTYTKWREFKEECKLSDDNEVAVFLLTAFRNSSGNASCGIEQPFCYGRS